MKYWIASFAAVVILLPMSFAPLVLAGDDPQVVIVKLRTGAEDGADSAHHLGMHGLGLGELEGDALELDVSDLEIGESSSAWTESGKEIVVTRTEDGHSLTIDGKELAMPLRGRDDRLALPAGAHIVTLAGSTGKHSAVRMIRLDHNESVGDRLLESGVLDELDEVTRQRILDELAEITRPREVHRLFIERQAEPGDEEE